MENNINEIKMTYNFYENKNCKRIRIFGDEFVENNKNKLRFIIKGKENELKEFISCSDINYKEIFGRDKIFVQLENIHLISVTLFIFHFEISGNSFNDLQL